MPNLDAECNDQGHAWCLFEMLSLTLKGQGYLEI